VTASAAAPMARSAAYAVGSNTSVESNLGYPVTVSSEGDAGDSQISNRGSANGSVAGAGILFRGSPREIFGGRDVPGDAAAAQLAEPLYWREVWRQTRAMVKKNFILARRNRFSTFLRVFVRYPPCPHKCNQNGSRPQKKSTRPYKHPCLTNILRNISPSRATLQPLHCTP
jgi:hypothetical protein